MHLQMTTDTGHHPTEHDIWLVRTGDQVEVEVDGRTYEATVQRRDDGSLAVEIDGERIAVRLPADDRALVGGREVNFELTTFEPGGAPGEHETLVQGEGAVKPPMPGKIVSIDVEVGDEVEQGQRVAVLEAMKMQSSIEAPRAGTVLAIHAEPGQALDAKDLILEIGDPEA